MGGKSGGGMDAGPSIEYGNKSLKLQREMYGDSQDRTAPFYEGGLNAFNMLLDGIGAQGGTMQSRDDLMGSMRDQYTTQNTTGGDSALVRTPDGRLLSPEDAFGEYTKNGHGWNSRFRSMGEKAALKTLNDAGYDNFSNPQTTSTTDMDGLNAAVDAAMAGQETPDNYGNLLQNFGMDQFQADPGYQFRLDSGNKAIERAAAARGQFYDPSTVKALAENNSNMADQTYGDAYNRFNNDQNTVFNRLAAVSGIGQTANQSMNNSGQNMANQGGQIYGQMGSAVQSAQNAKASRPSMFSQLAGMGAQLGSTYLMSDSRTKENIEYTHLDNGHKMYNFNYIGNSTKFNGVMAQDIIKTNPDAIHKSDDGLMMVDYDALGVRMTEAK